jgi:hypothetical protein
VRRAAPAAAVVAAVLASCALAQADDSGLGIPVTDPDKIASLMRGNTFQGVLQETGEPWVEFYCDTGRSLYDFQKRISLGKWWLDKGQVCFAYDWSNYEQSACFQLYVETDGSLNLVTKSKVDGSTNTFHSAPPEPGDRFQLEKRAAYGCQLEPSV